MKKNSFAAKIIGLILCFTITFLISPEKVHADISPSTEMPITYTTSVDNLQYPATNQFIAFVGISGVGKVVINEPTVVKAYLNWKTAEVTNPVIWFSRDVKGIDLVGSQATLTTEKNYHLILLDAGTYYFNYSLKAVNNNYSYVATTVGACIVGQLANSTERVYASSKVNPNIVSFNKAETGFLSVTAPIDYYRFDITEPSIVTIRFNFKDLKDINLSGSACVLKNSMDANIVEQAYNSQGADYNTITRVLETGTYFITMKGSTTITSLEVKKTPYVLDAWKNTTSLTKGNVKITLDIPFEYSELLVTKGNIPKAQINDYYTWSTYRSGVTKALTGKSYSVTSNGTYTFRIRDYLGNYLLYAVNVSNIDKTAPAVTGVANGKTYKTGKTIKFSDKQSGIKSAKLNNKVIKNGAKISVKGSYTLVVTDKVGNTKTIKFKIK